MLKQILKKGREELAGELWRCIKEDFEKEGIKLPEKWKGVGMAYGGYTRAGEAITSHQNEILEALIQEITERKEKYEPAYEEGSCGYVGACEDIIRSIKIMKNE